MNWKFVDQHCTSTTFFTKRFCPYFVIFQRLEDGVDSLRMGFVYCAWKDSANRMGDTGPIQEARHRLINEAGKNDEIMTGGGERDRPPLE